MFIKGDLDKMVLVIGLMNRLILLIEPQVCNEERNVSIDSESLLNLMVLVL